MKTVALAIAAVAFVLMIAMPGDCSAHKGSGSRAGAHHGGARTGGAHHRHPHVRSPLFFGALFATPGLYSYYYPPPYYYGPDFTQPHYAPPTVYVEQFPGSPTPETQGEIFCPGKEGYYPEVLECAGGWQRVIRVPPAESR